MISSLLDFRSTVLDGAHMEFDKRQMASNRYVRMSVSFFDRVFHKDISIKMSRN